MPDPIPTPATDAGGETTYRESVSRGFYGRNLGGLHGKHDNVRTYWEDPLTRLLVRPHVQSLAAAARAGGRGLRVLDLGCGAGQGFELLTRIPRTGASLQAAAEFVLDARDIDTYLGLDLSEAMLEQGEGNYRHVPQARFARADLSKGLGPVSGEPPFDVYFSSYGALSHLDGAALARLLGEIAEHAAPGAIVVLDLVGRLSLEWPGYAARGGDEMLPYSMSYLFPAEERASGRVPRFPLRFWTGEELLATCRGAGDGGPRGLEPVELLDRSVLVGRHVDTGEFGTTLPPLRAAVNSLLELNVRTPLERLRVDGADADAPPDAAAFLATLVACWNRLVDFTRERLRSPRPHLALVDLDGWRDFPPPLQMALMTMDRVVASVAWMTLGDVRANVIEPQLAYLLRELERGLQRGLGCGHGLVAVLRVRARA